MNAGKKHLGSESSRQGAERRQRRRTGFMDILEKSRKIGAYRRLWRVGRWAFPGMRCVDNVREGALFLRSGMGGYGHGSQAMERFGGGGGKASSPIVSAELWVQFLFREIKPLDHIELSKYKRSTNCSIYWTLNYLKRKGFEMQQLK